VPDGRDPTAPGARHWTAREAVARTAQLLRAGAARELVSGVLGETFYRRLAVYELDLRVQPRDAGAALDARFLGPEELHVYEELRPDGADRAQRRLAAGHRCFVAWVDGKLATARWVATAAAHVDYLGLELELAPGEVYSYDSFTAERFRGRGLSTASQARLADVLREEGFGRVLRAVLPENRAGVRDAIAAGFRPRGRIGYVRVGPWRRELGRPRRGYGLGGLAVRALGRTVYRRLLLTERPLDEPIPLLEATVPLEFAFLEPAEAGAYAAFRPDTPADEATRRLGRGERCWTARHDGRIVSARWVATEAAAIEIPYLGHRLELAPGQAYVYESFTAADQRGHGVSGAAGSRLARLLATEGYRTMLAAVWPDEQAILRANRKAGYRPIGTIHSVGAGRRRLTFRRR
jgi:L-amino acid N-acyltransferase YncA